MERYALAHELTHYRHLDHIWSLVRLVCLALWWFHPLVWAAAWLSRRDGELACDEGVLERLGSEHRLPYGRAEPGHPVIVDYFYHEEVRGSENTGKRKRT